MGKQASSVRCTKRLNGNKVSPGAKQNSFFFVSFLLSLSSAVGALLPVVRTKRNRNKTSTDRKTGREGGTEMPIGSNSWKFDEMKKSSSLGQRRNQQIYNIIFFFFLFHSAKKKFSTKDK